MLTTLNIIRTKHPLVCGWVAMGIMYYQVSCIGVDTNLRMLDEWGHHYVVCTLGHLWSKSFVSDMLLVLHSYCCF